MIQDSITTDMIRRNFIPPIELKVRSTEVLGLTARRDLEDPEHDHHARQQGIHGGHGPAKPVKNNLIGQ